MGRGDKKSKKGKITIGSYGVSRKKADNKKVNTEAKPGKETAKTATAKKAKAAPKKAKSEGAE